MALQAWHAQFLWQQSATSACNQERQHTLVNHCSLFSAASSALCCHTRSLLLRSLSCRTVSAQVLGVLAMMHTTARADGKELSAKKAYAEAGWKSGMATTIRGLCSLMADSSIVKNPAAQQPLCQHKSTLPSIAASGRPFEVCSSPDTIQCARQPSQSVQMC